MKHNFIIFAFLSIFFAIKSTSVQAVSCRIPVLPLCGSSSMDPYNLGRAANIAGSLNTQIGFENPSWTETEAIIPTYFEDSDLESVSQCKPGGLAYPAIKSQVLTNPDRPKGQILIVTDNGRNPSFILVDISKLTRKSLSDILPKKLGGTNSDMNIIASGTGYGNDVDGLRAIVKTFKGCNTNDGTIIVANRNNVIEPSHESAAGGLSSDNILSVARDKWVQKCSRLNGAELKSCQAKAISSLVKIKEELDKLNN